MAREYRKIKIFLVLIVIVVIPGFPAYSRYYSLSEADFLSIQFKFEAPDQIGPSRVSKDRLKVFPSSSFNHLFFPEHNIFEKLSFIFYQTSLIDLTTFILRC
jgi:hypothetical protein